MRISLARYNFSYPCSRKLSDVVKLRLLEKLPRKRIIEVWKSNYEDSQQVYSDHISCADFGKIAKNQRENRNFLIPLRKNTNAYFNLFSQFISEKMVLLTYLQNIKNANYKFDAPLGRSNLVPDLVVTFYDELKHSHDLVLIKVDILNGYDVSRGDSKAVLENLLKFYLDFNLFRWVQTFNQHPAKFVYNDFLRENNALFHIF